MHGTPGRIESSSSRTPQLEESRQTIIVVADSSESSPSNEGHQEHSIPGFSDLTLDDDYMATNSDSSGNIQQQDLSDTESEFVPKPDQFSLSSSPIAPTPSVSESLPENLDLLRCRSGTQILIHNSNAQELSPLNLVFLIYPC